MRILSIAAALLALISGSTLLSGCALQMAVRTPLFQAALHDGSPNEIFPLLAKEEVRSSNPQGRELILAILERRKADALRLIESGADINATLVKTPAAIFDGYNPIILAVWSDDKDIVKALVAKMDIGPAQGKIVSLSASSSDEITGALEEQGHGLFTYQLLKALTETAGRGTVGEVYAALKPRVQDEARRQNRAQTPQVFGASLDGGLR